MADNPSPNSQAIIGERDPETLRQNLAQADAVLIAVRESVREALIRHKRLGLQVVTWKDGRVVWVPAEQIPVDLPPGPVASASPTA